MGCVVEAWRGCGCVNAKGGAGLWMFGGAGGWAFCCGSVACVWCAGWVYASPVVFQYLELCCIESQKSVLKVGVDRCV